jgi:hypothetical protein
VHSFWEHLLSLTYIPLKYQGILGRNSEKIVFGWCERACKTNYMNQFPFVVIVDGYVASIAVNGRDFLYNCKSFIVHTMLLLGIPLIPSNLKRFLQPAKLTKQPIGILRHIYSCWITVG